MEKGLVQLFDTKFLLELAGFILNLIYLYFIIKKKAIAWIWSIFASGIFFWICYNNRLYLQAGLYFFYILIAYYGLFKWKRAKDVQSLTKRQHLIFILICLTIGVVLGYMFSSISDQHLPFLDGIISSFAGGTTLLIVSKHRENWLYWIVINLASIYLYSSQQLYWLSSMSLLLMLVSFRGYIVWQKTQNVHHDNGEKKFDFPI